jgi:hypothetical protein
MFLKNGSGTVKRRIFIAMIVLLMLAAVTGSVFAGGGSQAQTGASGASQRVKIAVAFWQIDAQSLLTQKYLSDYLGPALNTEFMFSEAVADADALITFMENAYAAGCQGIMNYQNSSIEQAVAKANELGMWIATQTPTIPENGNLPYDVGYVAADAVSVADSFGELVTSLVQDGKNHNVIIVSAGAGLGNEEQYEATVAILQMLASVYGMKYERPVETLAVSRGVTDVNNDKGIKITIYPGFPTGDTYVTGFSSLLQTGEYDTVLACNAAYARFMVAVDEVEKAFRKNIRISAITSITDQTKRAFSTLDSTGDTSLNSALLMPSISQAVGLFALVYNGITGHSDAVRVNGKGAFYNSPKWKCTSADEYTRIERINTSNNLWEVNIDEVKQLLVPFNPQANYNSIYKMLNELTAQRILSARGL